MILYFLRHASAGQPLEDPKKDEKRALDEEGILQSRYVGRALAAMGVSIDLIISSPLKRATQTASLVANELGYEGKLQTEAALRPEAAFESFRDLTQRLSGNEAVMVVGHNPSLTEFLGRSIGGRSGAAHNDFKKGAVAKVELTSRQGRLQWLLTPKAVRSIYDSASSSSRPKTSRK
jgi:phosphohistidine phosphatase